MCTSSSLGSSQRVLLCLPTAPVRSGAAPSPLLSEALPDYSSTSALASTCTAMPPPQKTGPFTHSRVSGHGLFKGAGYFSFIFPPQSSAEDSLQIHEPAEKKGKRGKPRVRSTDSSSSAVSFSFRQTQMESQRQNSELRLDRALWHPHEGLSCDCGVIKIQGNSAVPSRRRSG